MAKKKSDPFWIEKLKPGGLHKSLGVPEGKNIPEAKIAKAATKGGKVGKQAIAAQTLANLRPKKKK